jgi:aminodeoxyfutalosine deaminase
VDQRRETFLAAVARRLLLSPRNDSLVASLPKAELHLHLEGSIRPRTAVQLAGRHGVKLTEAEVAARYASGDFGQFLEAFKWVTSFLRTPEDYALVAKELAQELITQNVVYAEITLSIGVMLLRKHDPLANFEAIRRATSLLEGAESAGGCLKINWVFDAVRQFGAAKAKDVVQIAGEARNDGAIAFGIGGDELGLPARELIPVYEAARSAGLVPLIHAGEIGGPGEMREAIEYLGVARIGHGIAAMRDEALMDLLTERRIVLELCPTSNLRTGALARQLDGATANIESHPLRMFVQRGVPVTVGTDDPAMFETSLVREYELARRAGISQTEILKLIHAGFEHALMPEEEKKRYIEGLRATESKFRPANDDPGM